MQLYCEFLFLLNIIEMCIQFTLNETCTNPFWTMDIIGTLRPSTSDSVLVYVNDKLKLNITSSTAYSSSMVLLSNNKVDIKFTSGPPHAELYDKPALLIRGQIGPQVTINNAKLDKDTPAYAIDYSKINPEYTKVTVPPGFTLEVYLATAALDIANAAARWYIYDGEDYIGE